MVGSLLAAACAGAVALVMAWRHELALMAFDVALVAWNLWWALHLAARARRAA